MASSGGGCPVMVWDGPYKYQCALGEERGVCAYHGRFREDAPAPAKQPDPAAPPALMDDALLVERCAEALREHRNASGVGDPSPWVRAPHTSKAAYREEARVVLATAGALGATAGAQSEPAQRQEGGPDA